MIKICEAEYKGNFQILLRFSDWSEGLFNGLELLKRQGALLIPLHDEDFFCRFFVDAGALCWPHGLELSPITLYERCVDSVLLC